MNREISVLGCGWLGLPLAQELVRQGFTVHGTTTTPEKQPVLENAGIKPFLLNLEELPINPEKVGFFESGTLIISVPPKRSQSGKFAQQILNLVQVLKKTPVKKVLFVSSTGVYATSAAPITEISPLDPQNAAELIQAEQVISDPENPWETTILRFAGLFGPGREPGRFLAGKNNLPDPGAPVNLIHLQDCIQIIIEIIQQAKWGKIYNACANEHPTRKEFYTAAARKLGLKEPEFVHETAASTFGKLIDNQKLKSDLKYNFSFPDPLKAL